MSSSVPLDEFVHGLWEYVIPENEEEEKKMHEKVNSKNSEVKVLEDPVTNLAMLEESNLMFWIFEFGEEEGLTSAIDEKLDRLSFENESVASEVPYKGDVLQVHPEVPLQLTEKEEVCFLFRGPGGLGIQRVHGGASLEEWYLGLHGRGSGGGGILNPGKEVSGLGLDGLQEVVFNGRLRGGAVRGGGKAEVPNIGEWQCTFCSPAHCWNTRFSCYGCGTPRYWESGVLGQGGLGGVPGRGSGVGRELSVRDRA